MANKKQGSGAVSTAKFDPKKLTILEQEAVLEEYLGYHPKYFMYQGLSIKLNHSRFEAEQRRIAKETGDDRLWFNGWKPKEYKW